jgi:STE24 endopeptidase
MANEDKSARYHRLRRRASLLGAAWQIVFLLWLVLSGSASTIRLAVESLTGPGLARVVVIYVVVLTALYALVALPLAFYRGVVLERRYGLSMETAARWFADHARAAAIGVGCLIAASLVVLWLLRLSPDHWWIAAAALAAIAFALLARLAPVALLPLFSDVRPLANEGLRRRLLALTEQAGIPAIDAVEWRLGHRTKKANAALVGLGRRRRILISDTLLDGHSDEEVEAVLAHEIAHHVYGDIWSALAFQTVLVALGCYLADRVLTSWGGALGLDGKADVAALPLLVLAGGVVSTLLMPAAHALSRAHERRADRYALETTKNAAAFISAMRRLAARNLAEERPSRLVEVLFHTHPSTAARIEAARTWAPPAP